MALQIRQGGTWITPTALKIYSGGAWRNIRGIKIYANGAWRDVASFTSPISLAISPTSISKSSVSSVVTTAAVTATPTGGTSPYSYSWTRLSGASEITANSPTSASTSFTGDGVPNGVTLTAIFRCTVTDSFGSTASAEITVSVRNREFLEGSGTL